MIDLFDVGLVSFACLRIGRREVIVKLFEVARVIAQRVLADVTLVTQVFEKLGQEFVKRCGWNWVVGYKGGDIYGCF